jgi:hypothetical protein
MLPSDRMGGAEPRVAKSGKPIQMMKKVSEHLSAKQGRGPDDGWIPRCLRVRVYLSVDVHSSGVGCIKLQ